MSILTVRPFLGDTTENANGDEYQTIVVQIERINLVFLADRTKFDAMSADDKKTLQDTARTAVTSSLSSSLASISTTLTGQLDAFLDNHQP